MPVIAARITNRQPYAAGQPFGDCGAYERIDGVLTCAVHPDHPANAAIVDLPYAPRDAAGRVRFDADFTLVAPADPARGNGRLLVEAVNRGRRRMIPFFNRAPAPPIDSPELPAGDGFLQRRGYSVLSVGWQWDVYRSAALIGIDAPPVLPDGQPTTGQCCVEIRPHLAENTRRLSNRDHRPYPAANLDDPDAMLLARDWEDGPDTLIPRSQWQFAKDDGDGAGGITPSAEHIYLAGGFQPGKIYRAIYTAANPVVVGCGMLALRDAAAWLRAPDPARPLAPAGYRYAYAYGISQSGRLLRTMIYLGLNMNEAAPGAGQPDKHGSDGNGPDQNGRAVFDGLLPHVAGGRMGEFNHRFAQPSCQSNPGFGHQFPFADHTLTDPLTGQTDGLLRRLRGDGAGAVPKIIYTNSAAEYWRGDGCLTHIDGAGQADLTPADETRHYLFAGAQHLPGAPDVRDGAGPDGSAGAHPYNAVDYIPLLRAALVNLDRWASEGVAPPASRHPRRDDGTAVRQSEYLANLPAIPGQRIPSLPRLWRVRELDLGADAGAGIAAYPVAEGREYPHLTPAADTDGNDRPGIRLPDLAVPVGTHTGWNLRHPDTGAREQLQSMQGSTHWFAPTAAMRRAAGDPRPSVEERYAGREDYAAQARAVAKQLAAEGYILAEDVELVVSNSLARYDYVMAPEA